MSDPYIGHGPCSDSSFISINSDSMHLKLCTHNLQTFYNLSVQFISRKKPRKRMLKKGSCHGVTLQCRRSLKRQRGNDISDGQSSKLIERTRKTGVSRASIITSWYCDNDVTVRTRVVSDVRVRHSSRNGCLYFKTSGLGIHARCRLHAEHAKLSVPSGRFSVSSSDGHIQSPLIASTAVRLAIMHLVLALSTCPRRRAFGYVINTQSCRL